MKDKSIWICIVVIAVILHILNSGLRDTTIHLYDVDRAIIDKADKTDLNAFKTQIEEYVRNELEGYRLNDEMNR